MSSWDSLGKWAEEFKDNFNKNDAPFNHNLVQGYDDDDKWNRKETPMTRKEWKIKKREIEEKNKVGIYQCGMLNELYNALGKDEELVEFVVGYKLGLKALVTKLKGLRNLRNLPTPLYRAVLTYLAFIEMQKKAKYANSIIAKHKSFFKALNIEQEDIPFQTYHDWCSEHDTDIVKKLWSEKRYQDSKDSVKKDVKNI